MTLAQSLPAILNLFSFLLLLFFIYSILGVMVFGSLCKDGDQVYPTFLSFAGNHVFCTHASTRILVSSICVVKYVASE